MPAPDFGEVRRAPGLGAPARFGESLTLLRLVADGALPDVLSVHLATPAVALTRRETLMPGFRAAAAAAEEGCFELAIRPTGGRAAAMGAQCLVLELFVASRTSWSDPAELFTFGSERIRGALHDLGLDARVGAVPGEFCPGPYSVNIAGARKVAGTAQRGVRGARLFSALLMIGVDARMREVLVGVNAALGLEWESSTLGSLDVELPALGAAGIQDAVRRAWLDGAPVVAPAP